jgi:hypothetical protein
VGGGGFQHYSVLLGVDPSKFICVAKGRDVTFVATNGFESKISGGNALQTVSRNMSRIAHHVVLPRLLSFWSSFWSSSQASICTVYHVHHVPYVPCTCSPSGSRAR